MPTSQGIMGIAAVAWVTEISETQTNGCISTVRSEHLQGEGD